MALLLAAAVVYLLATRWGIGTSSDSAHYIRSARHLLGREQVIRTIDAPGTSAHYPPLYPWVLAAAALPGPDPLVAARWLHLILFLANVSLISWMVLRFSGSLAATAVAGMLVIFAPVSIIVHTMALSEPLFLLLTFGALLLLAEHLKRPRISLMTAAAIVASLAVLTRYVGIALVPAGIAALLIFRRRRDAILFAAIALLPGIAVSVRNRLVLGTTMNRDIAFHPFSVGHLRDAIATIGGWLFHHDAPIVVHVLFAAGIFLTIAAALMRRRPLAVLLGLFIASFLIVLIFSVSFIDFHTPMDDRILSPIFFAAIVLIFSTPVHEMRIALSALAVAIIVCLQGIPLIRDRFIEGSGYATRFWRESPTIEEVRHLPPDIWIYSNAADTVYLLTGRLLSIPIPAHSSASSREPNPNYEQQLEAMRDQLVNHGAVLVYFDRYAKRWYYPDELTLKKRFGLHRRGHFGNDGDIWDYVAPTTRP